MSTLWDVRFMGCPLCALFYIANMLIGYKNVFIVIAEVIPSPLETMSKINLFL